MFKMNLSEIRLVQLETRSIDDENWPAMID